MLAVRSELVGWCWRFAGFRWLVILGVLHGGQRFARWLAINTPYAVSMREMFLRRGDWVSAQALREDLER